ncbi:hypothetical protein PHAVU_002G212800 [Phaseolus vulgaris]|uniref:Uncharacterized protein n=1 Tax=Phaseolus vulgaris TaxID=3885 RepID=V7CQF3_PHAVU|nr:hypothetical protein PHAVU_002G212800g [Phaseolus vulgaris]ESW31141.1 hypothetical protein PHAVU_002G212800g [Phaseolus vulgaris]
MSDLTRIVSGMKRKEIINRGFISISVGRVCWVVLHRSLLIKRHQLGVRGSVNSCTKFNPHVKTLIKEAVLKKKTEGCICV